MPKDKFSGLPVVDNWEDLLLGSDDEITVAPNSQSAKENSSDASNATNATSPSQNGAVQNGTGEPLEDDDVAGSRYMEDMDAFSTKTNGINGKSAISKKCGKLTKRQIKALSKAKTVKPERQKDFMDEAEIMGQKEELERQERAKASKADPKKKPAAAQKKALPKLSYNANNNDYDDFF